jgi:hypothetical protein
MQHKKHLILVLGMMRSGTSALVKGLEVMGVSLGDHLMPPNELNKKGYWEDWDFHELNFGMLRCFKNYFKRLLPLTEEELNYLLHSPYALLASELLEKKLSLDRPFGVKVPTASLLLPFWKKICEQLDISLSVVIALRNPISVAISVEHAFPDYQEKSFWIWISSMWSSLIHSEGHQRLIVNYDALVNDPSQQMRRVAAALDLTIDEGPLQGYADHFIDPSLRHFFFPDYHFSNHDLCFKLAIEMYDTLLPVAADQCSFDDLKQPLQRWQESLASVRGLLTLLEIDEFVMAQLVDPENKK